MKTYFSTPYRYAGMPDELADYKTAPICVLPVPYDSATTYKSGSREAPHRIIQASRFLSLYDEETGKLVGQKGICTMEEMDPVPDVHEMVKRVTDAFAQMHADGKKTIMIGGDHSLSAGAIEALAEKIPDLSVLHIDAHLDQRNEEDGYDHSCVMQRSSKVAKIVSVAIRSVTQEEVEDIKDRDVTVFWDKDLKGDWIADVVDSLTDNVYVSIDLDGLDPAYMPAVGTPEPGGLSWEQFTKLIQAVGKKTIVGADVMELMPLSFHSPDYIAAKVVRRLVAEME